MFFASMKGRAGAVLLSLLTLTHARTVHAAPGARDAKPPVDVVIETKAMEDSESERLRQGLDMRLVVRLVELGVEVTGAVDVEAAKLITTVELLDAEGPDYGIRVELELDGERELLVDDLRCISCTDVSLAEQIVSFMPGVARRVEAEVATIVHVPVLEPVQRLGVLGIAGVSAFTGGVATLVTGGVLVYVGRRSVVPERNGEVIQPLDPAPNCTPVWTMMPGEGECRLVFHPYWRDQGTALMIVGGTAAAFGLIATALDLTILDRKRRVRVDAGATAERAMIQVTGRF